MEQMIPKLDGGTGTVVVGKGTSFCGVSLHEKDRCANHHKVSSAVSLETCTPLCTPRLLGLCVCMLLMHVFGDSCKS